MCMNRCNRSLRSCTNHRTRIGGNYRLRELPFMQHGARNLTQPVCPPFLAPQGMDFLPHSPGGIAPSVLRISEAVLQTLYLQWADCRLSPAAKTHEGHTARGNYALIAMLLPRGCVWRARASPRAIPRAISATAFVWLEKNVEQLPNL